MSLMSSHATDHLLLATGKDIFQAYLKNKLSVATYIVVVHVHVCSQMTLQVFIVALFPRTSVGISVPAPSTYLASNSCHNYH